MKRTFIGAWMALLGTIWGSGVLIAASQMLVDSWPTKAGRLLTTILERGLAFPFALSALFILAGLAIMAVEFFRK